MNTFLLIAAALGLAGLGSFVATPLVAKVLRSVDFALRMNDPRLKRKAEMGYVEISVSTATVPQSKVAGESTPISAGSTATGIVDVTPNPVEATVNANG